MRNRVRLDHKGIEAVAKAAAMQSAVKVKTEQVAAKVKGAGYTTSDGELTVETDLILTDRAHGTVTLAHAAGQAIQAKYGALTKAAAQSGLEVKDKR